MNSNKFLWKCDDGTYDLATDSDGVIYQNVPVELLFAAPQLAQTLKDLEQACTDEGVRGMCNLLAKARDVLREAGVQV